MPDVRLERALAGKVMKQYPVEQMMRRMGLKVIHRKARANES